MPKVIKITEADLRKIITEKLECEVIEEGIIGALFKKATKAVTPRGFSTSSKPLLSKTATKTP